MKDTARVVSILDELTASGRYPEVKKTLLALHSTFFPSLDFEQRLPNVVQDLRIQKRKDNLE